MRHAKFAALLAIPVFIGCGIIGSFWDTWATQPARIPFLVSFAFYVSHAFPAEFTPMVGAEIGSTALTSSPESRTPNPRNPKFPQLPDSQIVRMWSEANRGKKLKFVDKGGGDGGEGHGGGGSGGQVLQQKSPPERKSPIKW